MGEEKYNIYADWNPWHGCTKISDGCKYCYVYRQDEMYGNTTSSSLCKKNQSFDLPIKKNRKGEYKIPSGRIIFTCFTSDFLLKDADNWRVDCWKMIKERSDCMFFFFTKRIDRFEDCIPDDWNDGYENVMVGCTIENQQMADYRLPIFKKCKIKHKVLTLAPLLTDLDLSKYLDSTIEEVSVGGESGIEARPCNYDWILNIRKQCVEKDIPFRFHQTGANFIKDGKQYRIGRAYQIVQANKAKIDYKIGDYYIPEKVNWNYEDAMIKCKCCDRPIYSNDMFGVNKDGTINKNYCKYCFVDGEEIKEYTINDLIEMNSK